MKDGNGMEHRPAGPPEGVAGAYAPAARRAADDVEPPVLASGSPLRTVKGLGRLLYRMGRTFDGLSATRPATEEFLRTGNPRIIGSRGDYALLCDLRAASSYVLDTDWSKTDFDLKWFEGINGSMTRTASMTPGELRTGENVLINTKAGTYFPPIPNPAALDAMFAEAADSDGEPVGTASRLFARLAKAQPFGDGNKRSALLAANGLLIRRDSPHMLAVPVEDPDRDRFNTLLGEWYVNDDDSVIDWLAEWNLTNPDD